MSCLPKVYGFTQMTKQHMRHVLAGLKVENGTTPINIMQDLNLLGSLLKGIERYVLSVKLR